jgi:hypothetical protein
MVTKDLEIAILQHEKQAEIKSLRAHLPWECDVLAVTKFGYAVEYELKISRSDFKADFKKPKHKLFNKGQGGMISKFWFVVPQGLVKKSEVPAYAGLMYCYFKGTDRMIDIVKYPAKMKCIKVDANNTRRLYRSMMYRFLQLNFKSFDKKVAF